jgi:hypothetical protein
MRTTHTLATLEISAAAYDEIASKLRAAGYDHVFVDGLVDMKGIGLERGPIAAPSDEDVEWVVNDMGELGVRVSAQCYFCYKGESIVYRNGKHDDGAPILHRNVGKREFGETVLPMPWVTAGRREKRYALDLVHTPGLSFGPPDNPKYKWLPLPTDASGGGEVA